MVDNNSGAYQAMMAQYPDAVLVNAAGGQKSVYKSHHPVHGQVAIKIGKAGSADIMKRIQREVELLQEINSDYYPRNHEFRTIPPDEFIIVEEYVEGQPLSACLGNYDDADTVLQLIRNIVVGLWCLWERRVVHRDIKPDNIIIRSSGAPKIIDLGIARCLDQTPLTNPLAWFGPCTPAYAAPEQLLNRISEIGWRTDQFALGIVLVQLLIGQHPFDPAVVGTGQSIPHNIVDGHWARTLLAAKAQEGTSALCSTMLQKQPFGRYRKPDQLLKALDALLED